MNKKSVSAVLISAIVFSSALFSAVPATASDDDEGDEIELYQDVDQDHEDIEKKVRDEIKRKYGPREHLQMPPLVVRLKQERSKTEDSHKSQEIEAQDSDAGESGGQSFADDDESGGQSFSNASLGVENLVVTIPQSASTNKSVAVVPTDVQNMSVVVGSPVEISSIRYTLKTPAEKFVEAASFGLIAMLISALGLAAVVSSRAIRRK